MAAHGWSIRLIARTIASGMLANLVVLAEDPIADIRALRSVVTTIKRGRQYPRADYESERQQRRVQADSGE